MELRHIKTDRCPVCGSTVVAEKVETEYQSTKIRIHVNGCRWEYRQFACGCEIHFCPNFCKEEIIHACPFEPKIIEKNNKRRAAKNILINTIENLDVDDEYKSHLHSAIKYI